MRGPLGAALRKSRHVVSDEWSAVREGDVNKVLKVLSGGGGEGDWLEARRGGGGSRGRGVIIQPAMS